MIEDTFPPGTTFEYKGDSLRTIGVRGELLRFEAWEICVPILEPYTILIPGKEKYHAMVEALHWLQKRGLVDQETSTMQW